MSEEMTGILIIIKNQKGYFKQAHATIHFICSICQKRKHRSVYGSTKKRFDEIEKDPSIKLICVQCELKEKEK